LQSFKLLLFVLVSTALAFGWGDDGHKLINRAAVNAVPTEVPAFFKSGIDRIVYNSPEPDRWRTTLEPTLKNAQEPDHFINLERVSDIGELPEGRYEFIKLLYAKRTRAKENPDDYLPERSAFSPTLRSRFTSGSRSRSANIASSKPRTSQPRRSSKMHCSTPDGSATTLVTPPIRCTRRSTTTDGLARTRRDTPPRKSTGPWSQTSSPGISPT
jgi:hypothetical protein